IARRYGSPQTTPPIRPTSPWGRLGLNEKSKFLVDGPLTDIIFLYNASPTAPSVAKDIKGNFVFVAESASVCFAQSIPDDSSSCFVERLIRSQGAHEIKQSPDPCDPVKIVSSVDLVLFERGELLKQKDEYVLAIAKLIENDDFREYRIVAA